MVLGIALFKFRSLNKDVLSRLFPQKNRRISFHKSANFLNAFFHSYLCPPAFRYFLSFILPFPSFSVLLPPPFPQTGIFSCRRFKNRPPLLLQKYNRRPPNSFLRRGNCPQSLFASHRLPHAKAAAQSARSGFPNGGMLPCAVCLTINFSAHQAYLKTI